MRDIDLKTLRLLVSVCEHRHMARAAGQENIEASATSKRIAQLESDLGAPLLMRGRRGVAHPRAPGSPPGGPQVASLEQTLDHEQVGLPPTAAVHAMLQRASARAG